MNYKFEDGTTLWFDSLGGALEHAHKHNTRVVRELP